MKSALLAKYDEVESGDDDDEDQGNAAVPAPMVGGKKERQARKQATAQELAMAVRMF